MLNNQLKEAALSVSDKKNEFIVVSESMFPQISKYQKISIKSYNYPDKIRAGDVVVFITNNNLKFIHRVVWVKNFVLQTKGDANIYPDKPISVFDIVGIAPEFYSKKILIKTYLKSMLKRFLFFRLINKVYKKIFKEA